MKIIKIFSPYIVWLILIIPFFTFLKFNFLISILILISITLIFLIIVGLTPSRLIQARPTKNWKDNIKNVDTAIILAFGFEKDKNGNMKSGKANKFLLDWGISNTIAEIIFVQEGVWVAACKESDTTCSKADKNILRMHEHNEKIYINTLEALVCAIEKIRKLGKKKAIVISHDLQLQRTAWALEKINKKLKNEFTFIIPQMPDVPYPSESVHFQTRNEFIYKIVELLIARLRDLIITTPIKCKAPLNNLNQQRIEELTKNWFRNDNDLNIDFLENKFNSLKEQGCPFCHSLLKVNLHNDTIFESCSNSCHMDDFYEELSYVQVEDVFCEICNRFIEKKRRKVDLERSYYGGRQRIDYGPWEYLFLI